MGAVKSGNHVVITGAGNTLASMVADIADAAFVATIQADPLIVEIKSNVARYLYINNTGELTIGDAGDYSVEETLRFESNTAVDLARFYVQPGGDFKMYGNVILDGAFGAFRSYFWYWNGALTILGNDTYKPIIRNYREIRFNETQNNDTYSSDLWNLQKCIFGGSKDAVQEAIYMNAMSRVRPGHIFKDIIFDMATGGGSFRNYPVVVPYSFVGHENLVFENLIFEDYYSYGVYAYGGLVHLKNCTYRTNQTGWKQFLVRTPTRPVYKGQYDYAYNTDTIFGQQFSYLEGCTFEDYLVRNGLIVQYGHEVLIKDTAWELTSGDDIQTDYGSRVMLWTGNTFDASGTFDVNTNSCICWVYKLAVNVIDSGGIPIEDAVVYIEQKDKNERFMFKTDSDGDLDAKWGLKGAFLTNKFQYGNNPTTNAIMWSDESNSTYHDIYIFKVGYKPKRLRRVMDQDRTETVTLEAIGTYAQHTQDIY